MLSIKKEVKTVLTDTTGKEISVGDVLTFATTDNRCMMGEFRGIANRGALIFQGVGLLEEEEFHVMPKSIKKIFIIE